MEHISTTRDTIKSKVALAVAVALTAAGMLWFAADPVEAHGTGLVKICERDPNANTGDQCQDSSTDSDTLPDNALFANCTAGFTTCFALSKGPRQVEIQLKYFPNSTPIHVWWLNGSTPTDTNRFDCGKSSDQATGVTTRTLLTTITTNSSGQAEFNETLPRAHWTVGPGVNQWSYGSNWICATNANLGGSGTVGDRQFTIYPTPL